MRLDSLFVMCGLLLLGGISAPAHGNASSPQSAEEEQLHKQLEEGLLAAPVQPPETHVYWITQSLESASHRSPARQGHLDEALRLANGFVREHPNDWRSHFHLSQVHVARGPGSDQSMYLTKVIGALEAAWKVASNSEGRREVAGELGPLYERRQEWAKALEVYQGAGAKGRADGVREIIALLAPYSDPAERQRVLDDYYARKEQEARELEEQLKALEGGG